MGACTRGVRAICRLFARGSRDDARVDLTAFCSAFALASPLQSPRFIAITSGDEGSSFMRVRAACIVVAMFVLLPSAAHAQASITGVVKDTSGAVLPGVTVEAASPALIEKVRTAVTDESRPLSHRRSAARHLHGDVHADRLPVRPARRHRAARHVHRDGQRRPEGRLARGDDHRHRRIADRRRAERPASDGARQRHHHVDSRRRARTTA